MRYLTLVVGFCLVLAAWAYAQTQSQVIVACVHDRDGSVRIVGSAEECGRREEPLSWNQEGPPGPAGSALRAFNGDGGVLGIPFNNISTIFNEELELSMSVRTLTGGAANEAIVFAQAGCEGQGFAAKDLARTLLGPYVDPAPSRFFGVGNGPIESVAWQSALTGQGCQDSEGFRDGWVKVEPLPEDSLPFTIPVPEPIWVGLAE